MLLYDSIQIPENLQQRWYIRTRGGSGRRAIVPRPDERPQSTLQRPSVEGQANRVVQPSPGETKCRVIVLKARRACPFFRCRWTEPVTLAMLMQRRGPPHTTALI